jgi:transposase-like protein
VLGIYISEERNMRVAEKFIRSLAEKYGKYTVYILMMDVHGTTRHVV